MTTKKTTLLALGFLLTLTTANAQDHGENHNRRHDGHGHETRKSDMTPEQREQFMAKRVTRRENGQRHEGFHHHENRKPCRTAQ